MTTTALAWARHTYTSSLTAQTATFDSSILAGTKSEATVLQYAADFAHYCRFARTFEMALHPSTLARWRQHLFEQGYRAADGTQRTYTVAAINRKLASIRSIMAEAAQQGYITHEQAEAFKQVKGLTLRANKERRKPHARTRIEAAEMEALCNLPDPTTGAGLMHRALLLTLRYSGARISDVVTLRQSQIHAHTNAEGRSGWVVEFMGKNETEPVSVELGPRAKEAIDRWLAYRRTHYGIDVDYVFTSFGGRGDRDPSDRPMRRVSAWETVKRYAKRLGLLHIKPHDFRRYVGTQLAARDIRLAQKQLRHKRIETTAQHYVLDDVQLGHMAAL